MDGTVGEQLADFRVELQDSSRTAGGLNVRAQVKADAAMALQETARLITEAAVQEQKPVKQRGAGLPDPLLPGARGAGLGDRQAVQHGAGSHSGRERPDR